jgi:hypothetical protein
MVCNLFSIHLSFCAFIIMVKSIPSTEIS